MSAAQRITTNYRSFVVALIAGFLGVGCSDQTEPPSVAGPESQAATTTATPPQQSLARLVARALNNAGLRQGLFERMKASPVKEGKLHLRSYLQGTGGEFLAEIGRVAGKSRSEILGLMDQIRELEIYLPVEEHRTMWQGGQDVIVATQIDERNVPFGVDLFGQEVPLSRTTPPAVPTIVLVPAESFDGQGRPRPGAMRSLTPMLTVGCTDPTSLECSGGGGGGGIDWSTKPPGLYVTETEITDLGEGWPYGQPEVEIFTLRKNDALFNGTQIRCVAEGLTGDLHFDQDNHSWVGATRIATPEQLAAEPPDEGLMFFMLEDDGTACQLDMGANPLVDLLNAVNAFMAGQDGIEDGDLPGVIRAAQALISAVLSLFGSADDPIGIIVMDTCPNPDGITAKRFTVVKNSSTTPIENGCAELFLNE